MKMCISLRLQLAATLVCFISTVDLVASDSISFSRDIRPILSENCFTCHGPDEASREAGLRLDLESSAKSDENGTPAVVSGQPDASALIQRIESTDPDEVMPPADLHKTIAPEKVALLRRWIQDGARWGNHWSYEPVVRPSVPVSDEGNPIDAFIAARLQKESLQFAPQADKSTLIRRVAIDVTGLPPTLEELESLATKNHEAIVAHFISTPAFGEHWASGWLDLARYADSAGYPSDPGREIWAYRDWVIQALNENMPFDQFTIEQIAGDLLPNPTDQQWIATAFHRNTMTQNEGGTNDEEFRIAAVVDRVNTTFAVWMGTTMACAQCHTHKYDPISNHEYFQIYAFFNQSADADRRDETPVHAIIGPELKQQRDGWSEQLEDLEKQFAKPDNEWLLGFEEWLETKPDLKETMLKAALDEPRENRTEQQLNSLTQHYVRNVSPAAELERKQVKELTKQLADTKPVTVPVMLDLEQEKRRKTLVQLRGNWQALGDEVSEAVPAAFHPLDETQPRNRLGLARWLVSRDNPLTARVTVNRMWETIFGYGIVRSSEEFGSQGDMPVHPELLDWLAAEFMDSGWDVKSMLRLMFNSRAYRQSSVITSAMLERDPDNRLLSRGPRYRPSGEMLRDQALAVSGLLSSKMFGPPVRPLRPNLGLAVAFGGRGGNDWQTSSGEDRYRRSVYTDVRRNSPYPSFGTFDAPNREVCTIRRDRSNTPLQAFVTLNDPVFVEAHQALARRLLTEGGADTASRIRYAYRLCLAREPSLEDIDTLSEVLDLAFKHYRTDEVLATAMATEPLGKAATDADVASLAAWTNVASVIMNLDEFLMRR
jgi:hypothetical protein